MPKITVEFGGTPYPFVSGMYYRSYQLRQQRIEIVLPRIESISPGDTIEIKRDGVTVIKGRMALHKLAAAGDGLLMLVRGFDGKRKWHLLDAIELAGAQAAEDEIDVQLADTDLVKNDFDVSGINIDMEYGMGAEARFVRYRAAEEICFVTGYEFYEYPDWDCDFKAQCGTDRSATVIFRRGHLLQEWVKNCEYVETDLFKVDKVRVIGKGSNYTNLIFDSDEAGGYAVGDPLITITRKNLITAATCALAAAALRDDMKNTVKWGKFKAVWPDTGLGFDVFDTIQVVDPQLLIDESLRIASIECRFTAEGGEDWIIEVTNIQHLQTSGEILIGKVRKRESDDFARAAQIVAAAQVTTADDEATGLANVATGTHRHSVLTETGKLVDGATTALYAALVSGGSPTTLFTALTSGSSLTSEHNFNYGGYTEYGGGHNHGHGSDSHSTGINNPTHDH